MQCALRRWDSARTLGSLRFAFGAWKGALRRDATAPCRGTRLPRFTSSMALKADSPPGTVLCRVRLRLFFMLVRETRRWRNAKHSNRRAMPYVGRSRVTAAPAPPPPSLIPRRASARRAQQRTARGGTRGAVRDTRARCGGGAGRGRSARCFVLPRTHARGSLCPLHAVGKDPGNHQEYSENTRNIGFRARLRERSRLQPSPNGTLAASRETLRNRLLPGYLPCTVPVCVRLSAE